jgi:hypothetical protein
MTDSVSIEIELSKPVAEQVAAASALLGEDPSKFIDDAILGRLQAIDNLVHGDEHIELPDDFDADAWRDRYRSIRRLEVYEP